jgi:hypothetical protein
MNMDMGMEMDSETDTDKDTDKDTDMEMVTRYVHCTWTINGHGRGYRVWTWALGMDLYTDLNISTSKYIFFYAGY